MSSFSTRNIKYDYNLVIEEHIPLYVHSVMQDSFYLPPHSGPGAVGNKMPVIAAAIHTIKAITNDLIQPIL